MSNNILSKLDKLEEIIEAGAYKGAQELSQRIKAAAKELAPVDTGRLKRSITSFVIKDADGTILGKVGTNVEYAAYVELGTSGQAAKPYLFPAFKAYKDRAKKILGDALAKELKRLD
jgi:HK97 gp10 family phage protein